jgi:alpha-L-rhamnosidase
MALTLGALSASALEIRNPRCEYRVNPLGIDAAHPRLSWELSSDQRGMVQESYRILVASAPDLLNRNQGDLWDSGIVQSDRSIQVQYAGKKLESKTLCHWKVLVRTTDGNFRMGIYRMGHWGRSRVLPPILRRYPSF